MSKLDLFLSNPKQTLIEIDRVDCAQSFATFVKRSWHVLEPATELKWGWALDAICDHLEAVTAGDIRRLLINCPPGLMKSLLVSVFWPAWEWGPKGQPSHRYVSTAHEQSLAVRDSRRMRGLVESEWYQDRWPIKLADDANAVVFFENEHRGFRASTAFTSMTGKRGSRVILDDPHSVKTGESDTMRAETIRTFREALPSRVNDKSSAIVVIMQRLHERDVSGNILSRDTEYVHLCLPMRFEPERRCSTKLGFTDPRQTDGELLFPELFDEERTAELERELGAYGVAGQLQQRPIAREGGLFKRGWFEGRIVSAADVPKGVTWVRGWDLAGTAKKSADATAGVKMGRAPDGRYFIANVRNERIEGLAVRRLMMQCAELDGKTCVIDFPEDPGQAGKDQRREIASMLAGYIVHSTPETGDKTQRASPFASQCENGNVYLVQGEWVEPYLDQVCNFPGGAHDDMVDASSRAFARLLKMQGNTGGFAAPMYVR